jgi:hypothetical protein
VSVGSYERATQLFSAAAALAPITAALLVCFRTGDVVDAVRSLVSLVAAGGLHVVVMRMVRDRGNRVQEKLWASWGGSTTIQKLRWAAGPRAHIQMLHGRVRQKTGLKMPTPRQEARDSAAADAVYEQAVQVLRETTRDHERYPRVWAELKHYGAARNLYGVRFAALVVSAVVFLASAALLKAAVGGDWELGWWPFLFSGSFAVLTALMWVFVVTPSFVRSASERYTDALLQSTSSEP